MIKFDFFRWLIFLVNALMDRDVSIFLVVYPFQLFLIGKWMSSRIYLQPFIDFSFPKCESLILNISKHHSNRISCSMFTHFESLNATIIVKLPITIFVYLRMINENILSFTRLQK